MRFSKVVFSSLPVLLIPHLPPPLRRMEHQQAIVLVGNVWIFVGCIKAPTVNAFCLHVACCSTLFLFEEFSQIEPTQHMIYVYVNCKSCQVETDQSDHAMVMSSDWPVLLLSDLLPDKGPNKGTSRGVQGVWRSPPPPLFGKDFVYFQYKLPRVSGWTSPPPLDPLPPLFLDLPLPNVLYLAVGNFRMEWRRGEGYTCGNWTQIGGLVPRRMNWS